MTTSPGTSSEEIWVNLKYYVCLFYMVTIVRECLPFSRRFLVSNPFVGGSEAALSPLFAQTLLLV